MTAQIAEKLRYRGEDVAMLTNPLTLYFAMGGFNPRFMSGSTALWRGYVGNWEIVNQRLYLIGLRGTLENGTEASLATIFPEFPERVFAHWYSGTIRIPQGNLLKYVHMGYSSIYEWDFFLDVERGVVVSTRVHYNGTDQFGCASEGYTVGAMTIFARKDNGEGKSL